MYIYHFLTLILKYLYMMLVSKNKTLKNNSILNSFFIS